MKSSFFQMWILFLCIILSTDSFAQDAFEKAPVNNLYLKYIEKLSCPNAIEKKIGIKLSRKGWVPLLVSKPGQRLTSGIVFRNSKIGLVHKVWGNKDSSTYEVIDRKNSRLTSTTWLANSCHVPKTSVASIQGGSGTNQGSSDGDSFYDADLIKTMNENTWGVIYVWTPYMPLSVNGVAEIRKAMLSTKGHLTILLDPNANLKDAQKWVDTGLIQKSELKKAFSNELFDRSLGIHYPAAYLYQNGFLANAGYVGFKSANVYTTWINLEKNLIQKDMQ